MHTQPSHARLSLILVPIAIPAFFSLVAGLWVAHGVQQEFKEQSNRLRAEQLKIQTQGLQDSLESEIERLKTEAVYGQLLPGNRILLSAEVDIPEHGVPRILKKMRSPELTASERAVLSEESLLQSVQASLAAGENSGELSILRIKQDSSLGTEGGKEWLCLVFPPEVGRNTFVLAVIDPSQAFAAFHKGMIRNSQGKYRSYLIGSDGYVLVHSQSSLSTLQFSSLSLFKEVIRGVLSGNHPTALGNGVSMDRLPVQAFVSRFGGLPLALVVEEVLPQQTKGLSGWFWTGWVLLFVALIVVLILASATWLYRYLNTLGASIAQSRMRESHTSMDFPMEHDAEVAPEYFAPPTRDSRFFSGKEFLVLNPTSDRPKHDV